MSASATASAETSDGTKPRRGPGRPPSKPPAPALMKKGVVDSPTDPANRLEFMYGDPMVFKALFTYFRNLKARDIHVRCNPKGLTFFARDHSKTSRVVAHVAGDHVNIHYCEGEFWLGLNREHVEKMFAAIDKTFYKITILQAIEDPLALTFVLKDFEVDKECRFRIALSSYAPDEELYEAENMLTPELITETFPVEFTLTAKQFKKSITDASAHSDAITIEKIGKYPLMLTYHRQGMDAHEVYRNPDKISLRSSVPEGKTFRSSVKLGNVKSLASSMVTDDVRILCREDGGDILLRSAFDAKALVVSTMTKVG
jgi:intracellular sulfur oxidation DsrE/DsrF family protein